MKNTIDNINIDSLNNLYDMFCERVRLTPKGVAYRYYAPEFETWESSTWQEMANDIAQWQAAFKTENLAPGDSVSIMLRNCKEWVCFDIAALSLGLVVVPLYTEDRADNVAYILNDSNAQLLFIEGDEQWSNLFEALNNVTSVKRIITLTSMTGAPHDPRLRWLQDWFVQETASLVKSDIKSDALATVVYTSGTTGRPKGVMLSHSNILWNVKAAVASVITYPSDTMLSFLPLSHTLERTIGYYMSICTGVTVAYARSVADLGEDMLTIRPTVMISVPRIFERVHNKIHEQLQQKSGLASILFRDAVEIGYAKFLKQQGRGGFRLSFLFHPMLNYLVSRKIRAKFGGRIRFCICGGAALSETVSRTFIGLGIKILQGYGLTEHSPVISVNRLHDNIPASVGLPLPGMEIQTSDKGELMVRSPCVMMGYLNNKVATDEIIDEEGWLYTGDLVEIKQKHIFITGRLKEILVLSNGEKVPPSDIEMAIQQDPLFEQVLLIGEQRPFLSVLVVLNKEILKQLESHLGFDETTDQNQAQEKIKEVLLESITLQLREFPGYARVKQVGICDEPWTIDNALLTPTMKCRRKQIHARYSALIETLYKGH